MIKSASFLFVFTTLFSLSAAKTNAVSPDSPITTTATPSTKPNDLVAGCVISLAEQEGISIEEATKKLQELMDRVHVPLVTSTK